MFELLLVLPTRRHCKAHVACACVDVWKRFHEEFVLSTAKPARLGRQCLHFGVWYATTPLSGCASSLSTKRERTALNRDEMRFAALPSLWLGGYGQRLWKCV
ncbi:unnamed protein product [Mesocestoides corti]|uniref:N-acetyltransferase domain-containing protein n=1 Tax=Mesocestoides corti TaxID=53468 RepID=A0A0R3UCA7_MESCO|nr:unnamed protein product [Mesocestoides corti]